MSIASALGSRRRQANKVWLTIVVGIVATLDLTVDRRCDVVIVAVTLDPQMLSKERACLPRAS